MLGASPARRARRRGRRRGGRGAGSVLATLHVPRHGPRHVAARGAAGRGRSALRVTLRRAALHSHCCALMGMQCALRCTAEVQTRASVGTTRPLCCLPSPSAPLPRRAGPWHWLTHTLQTRMAQQALRDTTDSRGAQRPAGEGALSGELRRNVQAALCWGWRCSWQGPDARVRGEEGSAGVEGLSPPPPALLLSAGASLPPPELRRTLCVAPQLLALCLAFSGGLRRCAEQWRLGEGALGARAGAGETGGAQETERGEVEGRGAELALPRRLCKTGQRHNAERLRAERPTVARMACTRRKPCRSGGEDLAVRS